ncbi:MAG: MGMT family protein [Patescibacteria group bacterium]
MPTVWEKKILQLVAYIPKGRVITYKNLARIAGCPEATRAVGNALNKNQNSPQVPCHRVVKSNGEVGGYAYGKKKKEKLLKQEGIVVDEGKIVNMKSVEIIDF